MSTRCFCDKPAKTIQIREKIHFVCATPNSRRAVQCICKTQTCVCAASQVKCRFKLDYQTYQARKGPLTTIVPDSISQPDHTIVSKPVVIPTVVRLKPSRRATQRNTQ